MTFEDMIKRGQVVDLENNSQISGAPTVTSTRFSTLIFRLLLAKRLVDGVVVTAAITGPVPKRIFVKLAAALQR